MENIVFRKKNIWTDFCLISRVTSHCFFCPAQLQATMRAAQRPLMGQLCVRHLPSMLAAEGQRVAEVPWTRSQGNTVVREEHTTHCPITCISNCQNLLVISLCYYWRAFFNYVMNTSTFLCCENRIYKIVFSGNKFTDRKLTEMFALARCFSMMCHFSEPMSCIVSVPTSYLHALISESVFPTCGVSSKKYKNLFVIANILIILILHQNINDDMRNFS